MRLYLALIVIVLEGALSSQVSTACEDAALPPTDKLRLDNDIKEQLGEIADKLLIQSEFDFVGHPANYASFVILLRSPMGWNLPLVLDRHALARRGINLDNAVVPSLRTAGMSRLSALRILFDAVGLGVFVDQGRVVISTKDIAVLKWKRVLEKGDLRALTSKSVARRRAASFAAAFQDLDHPEWRQALKKALHDKDREVRCNAIYAIAQGTTGTDSGDDIVRLIRSDDLQIRETAVYASAVMGPRTVEQLTQLLEDPDNAIARAAARSFGYMGSRGNGAVPALLESGVRHADDEELSETIGDAIGSMDLGGDTVDAVSALLNSKKESVRAFAAHTLGRVGPPAVRSASKLLELLSDGNTRVRISAAFALAHVDLPAETPTAPLLKAANDPDLHVRLWSAESLRIIREKQ